MADWLSSTWEANWRSFQYFNLYRLVLAALFCLAIVFPHDWTARLNLLPSPLLFGLTGVYMAATIGGLLLATHWQHRFNRQLSAQMVVDIVIVGALMYLSGGVNSGLSVLLLVSLAAASLVGLHRPGRVDFGRFLCHRHSRPPARAAGDGQRGSGAAARRGAG